MFELKGYTTLKEIVANVRNETGDYTNQHYNRLIQLAIRVYKDLKLTNLKSYKAEWLTVSDINTIELPQGYVKFLAVGIPFGGQFWSFTRNNKLINPLTEKDGVKILDSDKGEGVTIDGGSMPYHQYASPPGQNYYYYKIDLENNRIILNGEVGEKVLLYYISTGISLGGDIIIPKIAEEVMIAGIFWMMDRRNSNLAAIEKQNSEKIYLQEWNKLKFLQAPPLDVFSDAIVSAQIQGVKR